MRAQKGVVSPTFEMISLDLSVSCCREPVYVKATAESVIRKDGGASIVELSAQGKAFKNVTEVRYLPLHRRMLIQS